MNAVTKSVANCLTVPVGSICSISVRLFCYPTRLSVCACVCDF